MNEILDILRREGGSLTINKLLIRVLGLHEALVYCEFVSKYIYYKENGKLQADGSFYISINDLKYETGLGRKPQDRAIDKLVNYGLITRVGGGTKEVRNIRKFNVNTDIKLLEKYIEIGKSKIKKCNSVKKYEIENVPKGHFNMLQKDTLKCPKGATNNTNLNNIINNTNLKGIFSDEQNSIKICFEEMEEIVNYYFQVYEEYRGIQHPILKKECLRRVIYVIDDFIDEYMIEVEADDMYKIIDGYFETNFDCDRNIQHFASMDILKNRYYEKIYR